MASSSDSLNHSPPFRVVVVDDSLSMRRWLSYVIARDPRLQLVGMAGSAEEARAVIKATKPDVLTLDFEMPGMNGLEFLAHLMRLRPMPVVMLASALGVGSPVAKRAMAIGAVASLSKPSLPTHASMLELCDSIYCAAAGQRVSPPDNSGKHSAFADNILLVGASTGGVAAIETLLGSLGSDDIPPIVIAQHMPLRFLSSFAKRLGRLGEHKVRLSSNGMRLVPGVICLAPSRDRQTCVVWHSGHWHIQEVPRQYDHRFCPSVDVLFASAVPWARQVGALLLTGLGSDGAKGMLALRKNGARTMGQSRESCVVYGMPGAALSLNASEDEASIDDLAEKILTRMRDPSTRTVMP